MEPNICAECGEDIPWHRKKNSTYCSDECYYEHKKSAEALRQKKKRQERELLRNDEILHELFLVYQSNYYITAKFLLDRNFNWNVHAGDVIINSIAAKKLIRYAYTLYNNQTVQLWKL